MKADDGGSITKSTFYHFIGTLVCSGSALADQILVDGDPLKDIAVLSKPEVNLARIMNDGKIYKNTMK